MNYQERRSRQHYSPELKLKLVKMAISGTGEGSSDANITLMTAFSLNGLDSGRVRAVSPDPGGKTEKPNPPHFCLWN